MSLNSFPTTFMTSNNVWSFEPTLKCIEVLPVFLNAMRKMTLTLVILSIALRKTGITSVHFLVGSKLHTLFKVMNIVGMEQSFSKRCIRWRLSKLSDFFFLFMDFPFYPLPVFENKSELLKLVRITWRVTAKYSKLLSCVEKTIH